MGVIDGNATDAVVITKSDTVAINPTPVAIYVGGTGDVNVVTERSYRSYELSHAGSTVAQILAGATAVKFQACPVGFVINCACRAVLSTGTTATLMVGYLP